MFCFLCVFTHGLSWNLLKNSPSLIPLFSTQSASIDPSCAPDQYPLSDMVCNKAVLTKVGAGGRRVSSHATPASTLNPTVLLCAALPCSVQSISFDQSCQLHSGPTTARRSAHVCVGMMNTLEDKRCHPRTCVDPNTTNLSPTLYHQVLLRRPRTQRSH